MRRRTPRLALVTMAMVMAGLAGACGLDADGTADEIEGPVDGAPGNPLTDGPVSLGDATRADGAFTAPDAGADATTTADSAAADSTADTGTDTGDATVTDAPSDVTIADAPHDTSDASAPHDSGNDAPADGTVADAPHDTSVPDVISIPDVIAIPDVISIPDAIAILDAGLPDVTVGPLSFCASRDAGDTFCVDFDESSSVLKSWCTGTTPGPGCSVTTTAGAKLALDTTALSAPRALAASVPAVASGAFGQALALRSLPPETGFAHLAAAVRIESTTGGAAYPLFLLLGDYAPDASTAHAVGALVVPETGGATFSVYLNEIAAGVTTTPVLVAAGVPAGAWHAMDLFARDGDAGDDASAGAFLRIDDAGATLTFASATLDASSRAAAVGAPLVGGATPGWTIHVDNVVARVR